jgi:hypothetical protein
VFAQAANIPFVYFAASSASPESSAILVKRESHILRASDLRGRRVGSLTLRQFLRIGLDERTPDHVTISRTRRLIGAEAHQQESRE